jgi:hypothetical protein
MGKWAMSIHTPAPWRVEHNARIEITSLDGTRPICHVYVSGKAYGIRYAIREHEANAFLMSASPEIYKALCAFITAHGDDAHEIGVDAGMESPPDECDCDLCNSARIAIKKAKGSLDNE